MSLETFKKFQIFNCVDMKLHLRFINDRKHVILFNYIIHINGKLDFSKSYGINIPYKRVVQATKLY